SSMESVLRGKPEPGEKVRPPQSVSYDIEQRMCLCRLAAQARRKGAQPSSMASLGQASAQVPQSTHWSASMTYLSSPSVMMPMGQASAQAPHLMQASVIL